MASDAVECDALPSLDPVEGLLRSFDLCHDARSILPSWLGVLQGGFSKTPQNKNRSSHQS